ncbi:hypothetical protein BDV93DRAFT_563629 [Ceratobasidium sp. AG-I]|nr:hypothetical protein BDV93DRAFT_563629 [Ceratobasidium sp. AG-I]
MNTSFISPKPKTIIVVLQCLPHVFPGMFNATISVNSLRSENQVVYFDDWFQNKKPNFFFRLIGKDMELTLNKVTGKAYDFIWVEHTPGDQIFLLSDNSLGERAMRQLAQMIYSNSTETGALLYRKNRRAQRVQGKVLIKGIAMMGVPYLLNRSITEKIIERFPPVVENFLYQDSVHGSAESHAIYYNPSRREILSRQITYFDLGHSLFAPEIPGMWETVRIEWMKYYTQGFIDYYPEQFSNAFGTAALLWRREIPSGGPKGLAPTPESVALYGLHNNDTNASRSSTATTGRFLNLSKTALGDNLHFSSSTITKVTITNTFALPRSTMSTEATSPKPKTIIVILQCSRHVEFPSKFEGLLQPLDQIIYFENALERKNPNFLFRLVGYGMRSFCNDMRIRVYEFIRSAYTPGDQIFEGLFGDRVMREVAEMIYSNSSAAGALLDRKKHRNQRVKGRVPIKCIAIVGFTQFSNGSTAEQIVGRFPPIVEHLLYYDSAHGSWQAHAIHYNPGRREMLSRQIMYFDPREAAIYDPIDSDVEDALCMQWIKFYTQDFIKYYHNQVLPNIFTHATMLWRREIPSGGPPGPVSALEAFGRQIQGGAYKLSLVDCFRIVSVSVSACNDSPF